MEQKREQPTNNTATTKVRPWFLVTKVLRTYIERCGRVNLFCNVWVSVCMWGCFGDMCVRFGNTFTCMGFIRTSLMQIV